MIAYQQPKQQYPYLVNRSASQSAIKVVPTTADHAEQMVDLMCATYGVTPDETYRPAQFREQVRRFPEGQFVAIDTRTNRVVGLTISMRVDYDPRYPLLESWVETTNYG